MQKRTRNSLGLLLLCVTLTVTEAGKYLTGTPKSYKLNPCFLDDVELDKCLAKNLQVMLVDWTSGPPDSCLVQSSDPYHFKKVVASVKVPLLKKTLAVNVEVSNIVVKGASKAIVKDASYIPKNKTAKVLMYVPKINCDFDYKYDISFGNLHIDNHDKGHIEVSDLSNEFAVNFKPLTTHDVNFFDIQKVNVDIPETFTTHFKIENVLGGYEYLEDLFHAYLHDKFHKIYEYVIPSFEHLLEDVMTDRLSKIFSYVPASYLLDETEWSDLLGEKKKQKH